MLCDVSPLPPTRQAFSSFMAEAADKIVMVDFHAVWCGPCKQVAPAVEAMAGEMTDVAFCKVDVDQNKAIAAQYKIESMPTFLFLRHGQVLSRFSGADPNQLRSTLSGLRLNSFDVIPTGTDVQVRGLKSQPQHNGEVQFRHSPPLPTTLRHAVLSTVAIVTRKALPTASGCLSATRRVDPHSRRTLMGACNPMFKCCASACSGTGGVITAYLPVKARYVVKLQGGEAKELSLKRANLLQLLDATVAETGAAATIAGLGTTGNFLVSTKETRCGDLFIILDHFRALPSATPPRTQPVLYFISCLY